MTDLVDLVALSLLPVWLRSRTAELLRAGDSPHAVLQRLIFDHWRNEPDRAVTLNEQAEAATTARARRRHTGCRLDDAAYPVALTTITDPPPVLWMRGQQDVAQPAVCRHRRIAGGISLWACRWPHNSQRISQRTRLLIVSGLARGVDSAAHRGALDGGGATIARARLRSGRDVSAGTRGRSPRRSCVAGAVDQRAGAGHAAAAVVLSAAQSDHQRSVARGGGDRGGREERIAHHRAVRPRTGTRRAGRAWECPEWP